VVTSFCLYHVILAYDGQILETKLKMRKCFDAIEKEQRPRQSIKVIAATYRMLLERNLAIQQHNYQTVNMISTVSVA
jgi:hypothetical protein